MPSQVAGKKKPAKKPASKKSAKSKGNVPQQLKSWLAVVEATKKSNPSLDYKEVLKKASDKYHKLKKSVGV